MTPDAILWFERMAGVAASAFVSGIWQGALLALGAAIILRLVPKTTAAIRFLVWSAVFVLLAMLPLLRTLLLVHAVPSSHAEAVHAVHVDVRWSFAIAALWLTLSGIRAAGLSLSAIRLREIWKRATPVSTRLKAGSLRPGDGRREAQLCTSADVDRPCVIGFFSPRVLVPVELFGQLTSAELEQIVLHEIGHLRRADDWINLLQKVGLVLFPLNPALLWIERRLCFERELACDEVVLQSTGAPKAYATCLTTLAERRLDRRGGTLSLGAWERQPELSRRVYSILRRAEEAAGMGRTQARIVLGGVVLALVGGAAGLSGTPQLVSFSDAPVPAVAEAQMSPLARYSARYQPVAFHESGAAHETFLKASMPVDRRLASPSLRTTAPIMPQRNHRIRRAVVRQPQRSRATRQWFVLTSWTPSATPSADQPPDSRAARVVYAVAQEQNFYPSYAAVPTAGGWLVFQL